jgi:hypothetical protein
MKTRNQPAKGAPDFVIRYWYDPTIRSWTAIAVDKEGNQVGDAQYCANRDCLYLIISDAENIAQEAYRQRKEGNA